MWAWRDVGVERLASPARVLPIRVDAIELVLELNATGNGQTEGGVIDLHVRCVLRQRDFIDDWIGTSASHELLYKDRRGY